MPNKPSAILAERRRKFSRLQSWCYEIPNNRSGFFCEWKNRTHQVPASHQVPRAKFPPRTRSPLRTRFPPHQIPTLHQVGSRAARRFPGSRTSSFRALSRPAPCQTSPRRSGAQAQKRSTGPKTTGRPKAPHVLRGGSEVELRSELRDSRGCCGRDLAEGAACI